MLSLSGLVVGWSISSDLPHAIAGYGLIMLFAFSMLWLGIAIRSPDAAQGVVFMVVFPMTFLANTFSRSPASRRSLRTIAEWNPISSLAAAVRTLFGNPTAVPADAAWPLQHCVLVSVVWSLLIIAIAMPLARSAASGSERRADAAPPKRPAARAIEPT